MKRKILRCPFCGSNPTEPGITGSTLEDPIHKTNCRGCMTTVYRRVTPIYFMECANVLCPSRPKTLGKTAAECERKWNTRREQP